MLTICGAMQDHVVGFNETAGNSLDHLHLVSHRPPEGHGAYPAQRVVSDLMQGKLTPQLRFGPEDGYPTIGWRLAFENRQEAIQRALSLITEWQAIGGSPATVNCAAIMESEIPTLYVFPRSKLLKPWGWLSSPAFLEMLGIFVVSRPADMKRIRMGLWRYEHFSSVLASLCPPDAGRFGLS